MDSKIHRKLAQLTLDLLSSEETEFWSAGGNLANNYTNYPDTFAFCGPTYNEGKLNLLDPDWRSFEMVENVHIHYYSYHVSEAEITIPFLENFLFKVINSIEGKDIEKARKYAGSLFHYLQDASSPAHSAEEHILRTFAPPPAFWKNRSLHSAIESGRKIPIKPLPYKPKLLGTDLKQTIFHAFYEIYKMHRKVLGTAVPILLSVYERNQKRANKLFNEAAGSCIPVCADLLHTLYFIARNRVKPKDKKRLEKCDLRSLRPIIIEQDQNYYDYTLDFSRDIYHSFQPTPFKMLVRKDGKIREKKFKYGIGMMTDATRTKDYHAKLVYVLYPGVYHRFQALVGLHSQLAAESRVKIQVLADEKEVFNIPSLSGEEPACKVDVSIKGAKRLTLFAGPPDSKASPLLVANKDIIWANPVLIK